MYPSFARCVGENFQQIDDSQPKTVCCLCTLVSSTVTLHIRVFFAALRCYAYKRVYIREQTRKFEVARARLLVSGGWKKWSDQANEKADLTKVTLLSLPALFLSLSRPDPLCSLQAIFNHLLRWSSRHRLDSIRGAFSVWAWASSVAAMASARATSMEEERRLQRSIVSESLTTLVAFHDPPGGQSVRQAADPGRGKQSAGPRTDPVVPGSGSNAPLSSLSSWKDPSGPGSRDQVQDVGGWTIKSLLRTNREKTRQLACSPTTSGRRISGPATFFIDASPCPAAVTEEGVRQRWMDELTSLKFEPAGNH
eukprot:767610-Hanusia_phi.AAC.4